MRSISISARGAGHEARARLRLSVPGHARLPEHVRPVCEVAYITGWRVKSEILTRQKHHLDLKAGWLRLEPGETKNGEGRQFPLTPTLRVVLEAQVEATKVYRARPRCRWSGT